MTTEQAKRAAQARYMAQFDAARAALQRAYCDMFKFWRACAFKRCRRRRACLGDANLCLKRCVHEVPRGRQFRAREDILIAAPKNAGPAARTVRQFLPGSLWR